MGLHNNIKKIKDMLKHSSNPIIRLIWRMLRKSKHISKTVLIKSNRSQWLMEKLNKDRVQQTTQLTWEDRYPDIFSACKKYFDDLGKDSIKILSYGCCTGEEVVTLRRYFPNATIVGAELNKNSLSICKKRKLDDKIHFVYSKPNIIKHYGPFDAVFCMAVLERLPMKVLKEHIEDLHDMYPFEKYNKQIHEIDEYVNNDGLLITHFSHYDIMDTDLAENYKSYGKNGYLGMVFDRNSKLKKDREFQQSIYIKHA